MTKIFFLISFFLLSWTTYGQVKPGVGGIFSQLYSKEIAEYMAKEYIINELLKVPNKEVIECDINSITASKSGELSIVIYNCKSLRKRGLLFAFWSDQISDFNTLYKGYAFRNFDFDEARQFFEAIMLILDQKKDLIKTDDENYSKNAIYKWDDLTFVFYKGDLGGNLIRVFWNGFDSEWNQLNLKTTKSRFDDIFGNSK
jgi:hypothetical protein